MTRTIRQQERYTALCGQYTAVAMLELNSGDLSLVGRTIADVVEAAMVIDAGGEPLPDRQALDRLIAQRTAAQNAEAQATAHLRATLQVMRNSGVELNLAELSRETGLSRSTIYDWLATDAPDAAPAS